MGKQWLDQDPGRAGWLATGRWRMGVMEIELLYFYSSPDVSWLADAA